MKITREDLNDLLQEVDLKEIRRLVDQVNTKTTIRIIQHPTQQTLMVPVLDPVSNTKFYGGEVLTTSTVVQVERTNGWAMVMDDNPDLSLAIATLDGAWGASILREEINRLAMKGAELRTHQKRMQQAEVAATTVNFDLM